MLSDSARGRESCAKINRAEHAHPMLQHDRCTAHLLVLKRGQFVVRVGQQIVAAEQSYLVAETRVVARHRFREQRRVYVHEAFVHQMAGADHLGDLGQRPLAAQHARRLVPLRRGRSVRVQVAGRLGHEQHDQSPRLHVVPAVVQQAPVINSRRPFK